MSAVEVHGEDTKSLRAAWIVICVSPVIIMFHQLTDQALNDSCPGLASVCNRSADGDALQLPTFSTAAKVRVIITFTLCAVSAVCNLVVLWAASNGGKRKSHVRILIMNLTVADLLVTFIVMPVDAVWNITVQWQAGDVACRLLMFMKLVAMYSCAFVTVVISLDRQSAILNPLGISEAKRKSKIMLTVAWTMSVVLSLPQVGEHSLIRGFMSIKSHTGLLAAHLTPVCWPLVCRRINSCYSCKCDFFTCIQLSFFFFFFAEKGSCRLIKLSSRSAEGDMMKQHWNKAKRSFRKWGKQKNKTKTKCSCLTL